MNSLPKTVSRQHRECDLNPVCSRVSFFMFFRVFKMFLVGLVTVVRLCFMSDIVLLID